jgi:succinyl-CoA synthetase alpha subunit
MSVLVDERTRLAVAGITGREGSFHTLNNRRYGTNVVGGVTPGKGGRDVEGIPVFDNWTQASEAVQPNTATIFVPPRFAADAILEAAAAGVALVVAITEGIPAHDELRVYNRLKRDHPGTRLVGPNCPGILSPGKANVGIIPAAFFRKGNVGVVSRSGTLTYQIGNEIAQAGFGCSTIVGIGGDPVPGSSFVEPVVAYIAGFTAPAGKQMGHAGAIVSGTSGTAAAKAQALEARGVHVGRTPTQVAEIAVEVLGGASLPAS